jgi:ribonuclease HI
MSTNALWKVNIDGAARGNPGPAAYAFVLSREGAPAVEDKGCLGSTTNNVAEYTALVRALEKAAELGATRLQIHSDSELLVKQMNGEYRVKNENLKSLFEEAKALVRRFAEVTIRHVPRAQNARADELCNAALDGARPRGPAPQRSRQQTAAPAQLEAVHEEAIACLGAAAGSWARGKADNPPPRAVWEQLWSILEENGVVKGKRKG